MINTNLRYNHKQKPCEAMVIIYLFIMVIGVPTVIGFFIGLFGAITEWQNIIRWNKRHN